MSVKPKVFANFNGVRVELIGAKVSIPSLILHESVELDCKPVNITGPMKLNLSDIQTKILAAITEGRSPYQYRFPKSRKRRIRKKWYNKPQNWRDL